MFRNVLTVVAIFSAVILEANVEASTGVAPVYEEQNDDLVLSTNRIFSEYEPGMFAKLSDEQIVINPQGRNNFLPYTVTSRNHANSRPPTSPKEENTEHPEEIVDEEAAYASKYSKTTDRSTQLLRPERQTDYLGYSTSLPHAQLPINNAPHPIASTPKDVISNYDSSSSEVNHLHHTAVSNDHLGAQKVELAYLQQADQNRISTASNNLPVTPSHTVSVAPVNIAKTSTIINPTLTEKKVAQASSDIARGQTNPNSHGNIISKTNSVGNGVSSAQPRHVPTAHAAHVGHADILPVHRSSPNLHVTPTTHTIASVTRTPLISTSRTASSLRDFRTDHFASPVHPTPTSGNRSPYRTTSSPTKQTELKSIPALRAVSAPRIIPQSHVSPVARAIPAAHSPQATRAGSIKQVSPIARTSSVIHTSSAPHTKSNPAVPRVSSAISHNPQKTHIGGLVRDTPAVHGVSISRHVALSTAKPLSHVHVIPRSQSASTGQANNVINIAANAHSTPLGQFASVSHKKPNSKALPNGHKISPSTVRPVLPPRSVPSSHDISATQRDHKVSSSPSSNSPTIPVTQRSFVAERKSPHAISGKYVNTPVHPKVSPFVHTANSAADSSAIKRTTSQPIRGSSVIPFSHSTPIVHTNPTNFAPVSHTVPALHSIPISHSRDVLGIKVTTRSPAANVDFLAHSTSIPYTSTVVYSSTPKFLTSHAL